MYACFLCGDLIAHISLFDFSPKASAIEIKPAVIPQERNSHRAHAVPGGPYIQTDVDGDGFETIKVDGTFSHTHTAGSSVETFKWTVNGAVVGNGVIADITTSWHTHSHARRRRFRWRYIKRLHNCECQASRLSRY